MKCFVILCCVGCHCAWCAYFVWIVCLVWGFCYIWIFFTVLRCLFGCDIVYCLLCFFHIGHDVMFFISFCYVSFVLLKCALFSCVLLLYLMFNCVALWFVLLCFLHHVFLCFVNISEFVCYWDMFKRMILLELFVVILLYIWFIWCFIMFDLFVEFVISFEIIAFTLRIYVSLIPFNFIFGFYCVMWHSFLLWCDVLLCHFSF